MTTDQPISRERKSARKALVLVVDDDPLHSRLIELVSDQLNITAHMASSCAEAMEALRMFVFDIVLMDIRMPEVDGHSCTKQMRSLNEKTSLIPIIAVTGNDSVANRMKCVEAGMDDFLRKPFTVEELRDKIYFWLNQLEEYAEVIA